MKKYIIFIIVLLIGFVSAQQGGGGTTYSCTGDYILNTTSNECEINMSSFTGCLVENCDYFCSQKSMDEGEYYKDNKCWCRDYKITSRGKILKYEGWIEISSCSQPVVVYLSNEEIKDKLWKIFKIIMRAVIVGISIGLLLVGFYHFKCKRKKQ